MVGLEELSGQDDESAEDQPPKLRSYKEIVDYYLTDEDADRIAALTEDDDIYGAVSNMLSRAGHNNPDEIIERAVKESRKRNEI